MILYELLWQLQVQPRKPCWSCCHAVYNTGMYNCTCFYLHITNQSQPIDSDVACSRNRTTLRWMCLKLWTPAQWRLLVCVLLAIANPSVVVCLLSVTFLHPTQPVEIFGSVLCCFCTIATRWPPCKILRRWSQGNPSWVKHKNGSQIHSAESYSERYSFTPMLDMSKAKTVQDTASDTIID